MITPATLSQLLDVDPIAPVQRAIVSRLKILLPGITIMLHPGRVDVSELIARTVVTAPGIGVGWSRVRKAGLIDGHYNVIVEWTAYIVAEARAIEARRVEKEAVGLAIGNGLLAILADRDAPFWDVAGVMPPEPGAELKPLFTVADASQGTVYYTVTWTQTIVALGATYLPTAAGAIDLEHGIINYPSAEELAELDGWLARDPEATDA